MPSITYHELSHYNAGTLHTRTFDLDAVTASEHADEIQEWLKELSTSTCQYCEEWIVCDSEDVPSRYVSEYSLDPAFFDYLGAVADSDLGADIWLAGIDLGIPLESIEDAYSGTYDNDQDFAQDMAESTGATDASLSWPHTCIDWEYAARELMYDYRAQDNQYFSSQY